MGAEFFVGWSFDRYQILSYYIVFALVIHNCTIIVVSLILREYTVLHCYYHC